MRAAAGRTTRRVPTYSWLVVDDRSTCWAVTRYPTGKRLVWMLACSCRRCAPRRRPPSSTDERSGPVARDERSDDRPPPRPSRSALQPRGSSHTKPGTLLKSQIPIRTWSQWDEGAPGFVEIDLVGHEGGNSFGEFCFTLTVTDIATGWTVNRSVQNKAAVQVLKIDHASGHFPFPILGIDSDNGSEFINAHLFDYCVEKKITFTRGRPGNKNDGAHVEQKNWTHVRELVGYLRFDTEAELELLNAIWSLDARFTNHLLAQQKLLSRERRTEDDQASRPLSDAGRAGDRARSGSHRRTVRRFDGQPRRSTQRPSRGRYPCSPPSSSGPRSSKAEGLRFRDE